MEWLLWFFAADVWLIRRLSVGDGLLWSTLLAIASMMLNTLISIIIFVSLTYLVRGVIQQFDGHQFFRGVNEQIRAALNRRHDSGQRMIRYVEKWQHHKYLIMLLINTIPFVPWVAGGTTLYAVIVRDPKALVATLFGLAMKSVIISGVAALGHLVSRIR